MKSVVSSKGQITLSAEVREKLGLLPSTVVYFELREGGVFVRKRTSGLHPVDQLFGRLKLTKSVDTLLDELRGQRPAANRAERRASGRKRLTTAGRSSRQREVLLTRDRGFYQRYFRGLRVIDPSRA